MTPSAKTLAEQLYVELVGRTMFASGAPVKPDGDKLARFCIDLAQTFERAAAADAKSNDPVPQGKFDVQLSDIDSWGKK